MLVKKKKVILVNVNIAYEYYLYELYSTLKIIQIQHNIVLSLFWSGSRKTSLEKRDFFLRFNAKHVKKWKKSPIHILVSTNRENSRFKSLKPKNKGYKLPNNNTRNI